MCVCFEGSPVWLFPKIGFQIATESSRISPKETQLATYHALMGLIANHRPDSGAGKFYFTGFREELYSLAGMPGAFSA
jgi:hypothetical protein